jgi:hypothetical protein
MAEEGQAAGPSRSGLRRQCIYFLQSHRKKKRVRDRQVVVAGGMVGGELRNAVDDALPISSTRTMDDVTFLASPISTLVDSLTSSAYTYHDLLDAYATLNTRLISSVRQLGQKEATFGALEGIRENAVSLARAIQRDLLRATREPCLDSETVASGSSVTALELQVQALQNEVVVCHAAVQLVATVFKHPRLSGLIRGEKREY